ncbi:MAG: xanthine dehydrogenase [Geminicoccaceae bacterium]|nr:MAG: xanthine dehydrogenase [Geminicoccaceae bacterium]
MTPAVLEALLAAQKAHRPAVLVRRLDDNEQTLIVDGERTTGPLLPPSLDTVVQGAVRNDKSTKLETPDGSWFVQVFNPPLRLVVVGAVHIAQALVPMAQLAGYAVTVVDPRRAFAAEARFPDVPLVHDWPDEALDALAPDARTAVVTLTHDPKLDDPALTRALHSQAFYIAALGSKKTHASRVQRLHDAGFDDTQIARIHGPAGLNLGAVSPAEIAISVMAQMTQVLRSPR